VTVRQSPFDGTKLPLWYRALLWTDRLAWFAYRAETIARDELLRAWLAPELRDAATADAYGKQPTYLPGGNNYEKGLFGWEKEVIEGPDFPKSGRLLLGAAGGGRELRELLSRGYDVVAFEPNEILREGAQAVARKHGVQPIVDASYVDLVRAAKDRTGPLAGLVDGPFAGVILGWGSFTHVLDPQDHLALLKALRTVAPQAPVLISIYLRRENAPRGKSDRLRDAFRFAFARMGRGATEALSFDPETGFVYCFTETELHKLAFESGYEARLSPEPFPHALLVPLGS
jgi:hypothetical protein